MELEMMMTWNYQGKKQLIKDMDIAHKYMAYQHRNQPQKIRPLMAGLEASNPMDLR